LQMLHEMEILGPDNSVVERLSNLHSAGLHASLSDSTGSLIYELKIPLAKGKNNLYPLNVEAGRTLGIGFETGQFTMRRQNRESGEGSPDGDRFGRGGGGFGRGGMRGGLGGRQFQGAPEPLKVWTKVQLAVQGSSQ
jgi:hypothetical protein